MHCISSVGSMAVELGLSSVGLVDESVEINLGEFIYVRVFLILVIYRMWPVNLQCISSLLVGKCLDHIDVDIICNRLDKQWILT